MAWSFQFLLHDMYGRRLAPLHYESFSFSMAANASTTLSMQLVFAEGADITEHMLIEVWASPGYGVALWPWDEYIVSNVAQTIAQSGQRFYTLTAQDILWTLGGLVNRYASKVWIGAADDYMRWIFRGNVMADGPGDGSTDAGVRRRTPMFGLPIACEPDMALGPKIQVTSPGGQLLGIMQSAAKKAMQPADGVIPGRPLFFDMYASQRNPLGFTFAVFPDQRGRDLTAHTPVILTANREIIKTEIEQDFASEVNAVYYTAGTNQRVKVDTQRSLRAPFARRESTAGTTLDSVTALRDGRVPLQIRGALVDTDNCVFGRDYWWGDAVLVNTGALLLPMRLDTISISGDAAGNVQRGARFNLIQ